MSPHDEEVIRSNDATIKDMEVCTFFFSLKQSVYEYKQTA